VTTPVRFNAKPLGGQNQARVVFFLSGGRGKAIEIVFLGIMVVTGAQQELTATAFFKRVSGENAGATATNVRKIVIRNAEPTMGNLAFSPLSTMALSSISARSRITRAAIGVPRALGQTGAMSKESGETVSLPAQPWNESIAVGLYNTSIDIVSEFLDIVF